MKVLTSQQMREIDRKAIEDIGIIGPILMENAGRQIFLEIMKRFPDVEKEKILIVAGKGNNGGDGFVVARHLHNRGACPRVILLSEKKELRGDAALNAAIVGRMGIAVSEAPTEKSWALHKKKLKQSTLVVDAIFGTGLAKPARGHYASAIEDINKSKAFIVAVDIPSGLSSDSHQIIGPCVRADLTVCMAAPKIAHIFTPAEECIGELVIADIGLPPALLSDSGLKLELVEKEDIKVYFKPRKRNGHKGSYGHLFILSGSTGKTGASIMAGKAALKMGAGLVTVGTPQSCLPIVARGMVELMTEPLAETLEGTFSAAALPRALELLEGKDALMMGPGISTNESTADFVCTLLPRIKVPIVLDADALNILAEKPDLLKKLKKTAVITPHPGEFARLLGLSTKEVLDRKLDLVPQYAKEFGVIVVLKSYRTLIAIPDGRVYINPTGNPGMATAGSGDVLSGMIASMLIQEKNPLLAVLAAVYIHGLSGDLGVLKLGEKPLTASNLIGFFPAAIKKLNA
ncbi:MAG: NAD(P)H-hydrate dehydratase [Candidatus Aminicenantes bacterium]|nr:NAD(P)H-hydrate dehydratase [Candidatus Aminicenantes bacterium]